MPFDAASQKAVALTPPRPPLPATLAPGARLRAASAVLAASDPALAEGLALVAASGVGLAEAMGWASDWWSASLVRQRDELIRAAAAAMEGSMHARAKELEQMLRRGTSPAAREILALNDGRPLAWRQILRRL